MAVAEFFADLVGADAPIAFRAYDGSRAGPVDAPATVVIQFAECVAAPGHRAERARCGSRLRCGRDRPRRRHLRGAGAAGPVGGSARGAGADRRRAPDPRLARAPAARAARRGGAAPRTPAFEGTRRRGDRTSLRRLERLLPARARRIDDVLVRGLDGHDDIARGSAGEQVRAGRDEARPASGHAAPRHRLRLGRDDPARGPPPWCAGRRGHALTAAGRVRREASGGRGPLGPGRGPVPGLPRHRRRSLRRGELDRDVRARRLDPAGRVLRPRATTWSRPAAGSSTTASANLPSRLPRTRPPGCGRRHGSGSAAGSATTSSTATSFPTASSTRSGWSRPRSSAPGFEARHVESLREHYSRTLRQWLRNLEGSWDAAVRDAGEARARVWRLYIAASAVGFDTNRIQIHQVLATRTTAAGDSGMPLRPTFT